MYLIRIPFGLYFYYICLKFISTMLTISTGLELITEKERISHIRSSKYLMEISEHIVLECSCGKFTYSFIDDVFELGDQKTIKTGDKNYEVLKVGDDEFELHDIGEEWLSVIVDVQDLKKIINGNLNPLNLKWLK